MGEQKIFGAIFTQYLCIYILIILCNTIRCRFSSMGSWFIIKSSLSYVIETHSLPSGTRLKHVLFSRKRLTIITRNTERYRLNVIINEYLEAMVVTSYVSFVRVARGEEEGRGRDRPFAPPPPFLYTSLI